MTQSHSYLMENDEEAFRLDIKTDPEAVREQARWCGLSPGMRVLDAGCGPGRVTSVLHEVTQPNGSILGVDYSTARIEYAIKNFGTGKTGIDFRIHDLRNPLKDVGLFDLIWVRFVLEYNRTEAVKIVHNLSDCLKPDGCLCLLDLDYNCLSHYELPQKMEKILLQAMSVAELANNFDPYVGRKLYSYLYDLGYKNIRMDMKAHHLIYGKVKEPDLFNWTKKMEVGSQRASNIFEGYPGGQKKFFADFTKFFNDPRRFTYTPLILCKGLKPS
ncbi:methyltransferase domain protein [delta proteobacterium NaphS2]|nr:methyltransferase domain protein [delta proteobacterium NaphS2]